MASEFNQYECERCGNLFHGLHESDCPDCPSELERVQANLRRMERWEELWGIYVAKLARYDELKAAGRYGYQLSMPRVAIRIAREKLQAEFPEECKTIRGLRYC